MNNWGQLWARGLTEGRDTALLCGIMFLSLFLDKIREKDDFSVLSMYSPLQASLTDVPTQ